MTALATAERDRVLDRLERERFDCVVIGGGITGAGIAREAALRGLSVALLEAEDYASGTSSRSSKLIHGGLRYLAMGDVALVRQTALERKKIHGLAPHLAAAGRVGGVDVAVDHVLHAGLLEALGELVGLQIRGHGWVVDKGDAHRRRPVQVGQGPVEAPQLAAVDLERRRLL